MLRPNSCPGTRCRLLFSLGLKRLIYKVIYKMKNQTSIQPYPYSAYLQYSAFNIFVLFLCRLIKLLLGFPRRMKKSKQNPRTEDEKQEQEEAKFDEDCNRVETE